MKLLFVFPILLGLLIPYQTINSPAESSPLAGETSKELQGFSLSGPNVVNVSTLANQTENPYKEKVLSNRVAYSDSSIWQGKGRSLADIKASDERVFRAGMGKGL